MSPPSSTKESADASANTDQRVKTSTTARPEMVTQHTEIVKNTDAASSFDPDAPLESDSDGNNRRRAILAVTPFLVIGLGNLVLLLGWGIEPLWAFAILPPILFCSALAYIVFSTDFLSDRT
ncbi:uncharacterized protein Hqrw_2971 [Haloquadratum walsbyi C23]|uniref:DUF8142 domain-containing protein n=2 Tax=Haloquadratum walsbyi TaxID=293091 RepID=G0LLG3_HALWC|nr:hypothetical protein [Haloquadratum walsbyi]CCC40769.1 uncharacterized protein Hqrw_2971 [Haloquadratum walsbyi C23]